MCTENVSPCPDAGQDPEFVQMLSRLTSDDLSLVSAVANALLAGALDVADLDAALAGGGADGVRRLARATRDRFRAGDAA